MASHRMPDQDRPRRPVPAWVTAPPVDPAASAAQAPAVDGLEAHPAPAAPAPVAETVGPDTALPTAVAPGPLAGPDIVVPDYPPQEDLLPPAPTSPTVDTLPFDPTSVGPAPVSPVDLAPPAAPPAPAAPVVGQPRFSVPGLEHVVVEGTEPEPSGPIGYRTPARFARQQAPLPPSAPAPVRPFDALVAPPADAPAAGPDTAAPAVVPSAEPTSTAAAADARPAARPAPTTEGSDADQAEPRLPNGAETDTDATTPAAPRRRAVGPTAAAVLGAVAGLLTIGLAAWWFTAPSTVHGVGVVLGLLGTALSVTTLRDRGTTWQRPVALLGAVLGGVGTLVLLWAVASALLPLTGVTLPDLTGTGTVPALAP